MIDSILTVLEYFALVVCGACLLVPFSKVGQRFGVNCVFVLSLFFGLLPPVAAAIVIQSVDRKFTLGAHGGVMAPILIAIVLSFIVEVIFKIKAIWTKRGNRGKGS